MRAVKPAGIAGGIQDLRSASLDPSGIVRRLRHGIFYGVGTVRTEPGSEIAMRFFDNTATPKPCTSVCEIMPFAEYVLVVAYSAFQQTVYAYVVDAEFTGWYDNANVFTPGMDAEPIGVIWTGVESPPVVTAAELLNNVYIANLSALDTTAFYFETKYVRRSAGGGWEVAFLRDGLNNCFFTLVATFQGHLFGAGFQLGTDPATSARPELVHFSTPLLSSIGGVGSGSFPVGHRARSPRDRISNMTVVADVLYVGTPYAIWPVYGYGRDSWDKSEPIDDSHGIVGPRAACAAGKWLYYWSPVGPMRVSGRSTPEQLGAVIPVQSFAAIDTQRIVAVYDAMTFRVMFYHQTAGYRGNELLCAFDTVREKFISVDTEIGFPVSCAIGTASLPTAAQSSVSPPSAPPSVVSTSGVTAFAATATWSNGDTRPDTTTVIEYRTVAGPGDWVVAGEVSHGVTAFRIENLALLTQYEWRVRHKRFGLFSEYAGPSASSQFTTTNVLSAPLDLSAQTSEVFPWQAEVSWEPSGEPEVSTVVELQSSNVTWFQAAVLGPGTTSFTFTEFDGEQNYSVRIKHRRTGYVDSTVVGPVNVYLTASGGGS